MQMRCVACVLMAITFHTNALINEFEGDCKTLYPTLFTSFDWSQFGFPMPTKPVPSLGDSYILKYEYKDFFAEQPAWIEEYFDKNNQRAKIMAVSLGVEFADIYDYVAQRVMSYRARKPATSGWDPQTQYECGIYEMKSFVSTYLPMGFPCVLNSSGHCDMPTANEALKFGGSYTYKYKQDANKKIARNFDSELFTACIKDKFMNGSYESYYYWGNQGSPSRFPSGEEKIPIYVEQQGKYWKNGSEREYHVYRQIPWYQQDPKFSDEMFEIPPSMYCKNYTPLHAIPAMPKSFSFSQDEYKFTLNSTGFLDGGFSHVSFKQIRYSDNLKLVRVDMKPSEEDKKGHLLKNVSGINGRVSIVLDFNYDFAFVAHSVNEECVILPVDKSLFLCDNESDKCDKISPKRLFGITANLTYKGKFAERGIHGETWSQLRNETHDGKETLTRHEVSFQSNQEEESGSDENVFVPIRQVDFKEVISQGDENSKFKQDVLLKNYYEFSTSPAGVDVYDSHPCLQRHKSKLYTLQFQGGGLVEDNKARFLPELRKAIKSVCNPETMLRFQLDVRGNTDLSDKTVYIRILDPFHGNETTTEHFASTIKKFVDEENFMVCFTGFAGDKTEKAMHWEAVNGTFIEKEREPSVTTAGSEREEEHTIKLCSS